MPIFSEDWPPTKRYVAYGEGYSGDYDTYDEADAVVRANGSLPGAVYVHMDMFDGPIYPVPPADVAGQVAAELDRIVREDDQTMTALIEAAASRYRENCRVHGHDFPLWGDITRTILSILAARLRGAGHTGEGGRG